jgi:hypothetical protein
MILEAAARKCRVAFAASLQTHRPRLAPRARSGGCPTILRDELRPANGKCPGRVRDIVLEQGVRRAP